MTRPDYQKLVALIRQTDPQIILRVAGRCDGHTIFKPEAFTDLGLAPEIVEAFTHTHKSDGSPKGSIFVGGQAVQSLKGVYGLDLLEFLAQALDVKYRGCLGRGFQAAAIQQALQAHFVQVPAGDANPV